MPALKWDTPGQHYYETGVKNGVLYKKDSNGAYTNAYVWNGLTAVTESPSGAEATPLYADDIKYLNLISAEDFGCTIEAYSAPAEFASCDGQASLVAGVTIGQQDRETFGLAYVTTLGNDDSGNSYGYKIHLVYGCTAAPSERAYATINDSPEAITFSWEITTVPVPVTGHKDVAHIELDSTKIPEAKMTALKNALFGTDGTPGSNAYLPTPDQIVTIYNSAT